MQKNLKNNNRVGSPPIHLFHNTNYDLPQQPQRHSIHVDRVASPSLLFGMTNNSNKRMTHQHDTGQYYE